MITDLTADCTECGTPADQPCEPGRACGCQPPALSAPFGWDEHAGRVRLRAGANNQGEL